MTSNQNFWREFCLFLKLSRKQLKVSNLSMNKYNGIKNSLQSHYHKRNKTVDFDILVMDITSNDIAMVF